MNSADFYDDPAEDRACCFRCYEREGTEERRLEFEAPVRIVIYGKKIGRLRPVTEMYCPDCAIVQDERLEEYRERRNRDRAMRRKMYRTWRDFQATLDRIQAECTPYYDREAVTA